MKKLSLIIIIILSYCNVFSQGDPYSIEYEYNKVGVFNPEWEIYKSLNPKKFEHITGYYREELARIIIERVRSKEIRIYDQRKREISLDTIIKNIIEFEKREFGHILRRDSALNFIIPYISAYSFEEFTKYDYKNLKIEKRIKAYSPTLIRYKSFADDKIDTIQLGLFWIFPQDEVINPKQKDKKEDIRSSYFEIQDTIISLQGLKYPVQNPYVLSMFSKAKNKDACILKSDGSRFKSPQDIDDLFILKKKIVIENEDGVLIDKEIVSDIIPEDINNIRIGEIWSIDKESLSIKKEVKYIIPLLNYDEKGFKQLGIRIE